MEVRVPIHLVEELPYISLCLIHCVGLLCDSSVLECIQLCMSVSIKVYSCFEPDLLQTIETIHAAAFILLAVSQML